MLLLNLSLLIDVTFSTPTPVNNNHSGIAQLGPGRDYFLWADLPVPMVGIMLALSCPG